MIAPARKQVKAGNGPHIRREVLRTSRLRDYFSADQLRAQTGHALDQDNLESLCKRRHSTESAKRNGFARGRQ